MAEPATPLPSGNNPDDLVRVRRLGWSWAAFLMPYFWLMGHGRLTWGMLLTVTAGLPMVSFLHILAYPAAAYYLGRRGNEIAWTYCSYHSVDDLVRGEKEWVLWGVVFKVLLILGMVFFLLYFLWLLRQPAILDIYDSLLSP